MHTHTHTHIHIHIHIHTYAYADANSDPQSTFHHLTQRVDVLPRFPTLPFFRFVATQRPDDTDFTNDPPHQLDQGEEKGKKSNHRSNNSSPITKSIG